jgi:hypothetical protein
MTLSLYIPINITIIILQILVDKYCIHNFALGEDWPPHCPHWRECKLKPTPILCLLIRNWMTYGLIWYFWNQIWSQNIKIDNLPISGFLPRGNEGVGSPWPNFAWLSFFGRRTYRIWSSHTITNMGMDTNLCVYIYIYIYMDII